MPAAQEAEYAPESSFTETSPPLVKDGDVISVKGPKGELSSRVNEAMNVAIENNEVVVTRPSDVAANRAAHGLTRTLISNMVEGVTEGYTRKLDIVGVGFRAEMKGKILQLNIGYSHPIMFVPPESIRKTGRFARWTIWAVARA